MQELPKVHSNFLITCDFFGAPLVFTATFGEFPTAADERLLVNFCVWDEALSAVSVLLDLAEFGSLVLVAAVQAS